MFVMDIWYTYRDFLKWVLETIADTVHSGGLAIIIFTLIIKTLLLPLTLKSIRSMKAMQEIQPRIKELQKKYGKNREELQKQTMALYAAHKVNPVAGCLPMVIQIPIFWGVYHAILPLSRSGEGFFGGSFLWLNSLGVADHWHILPILAGIFQFIQMRMSRPRVAPAVVDQQQQIMNTMMNVMPLFVVVFGWTFASGAVLYWATQSVYSVIQQWFVTGWGELGKWAPWLPELPEHRRLGYVKPRNIDEIVVEYNANGTPRAGGLMGRLQARMEAAQAQQEERRRELHDAKAESSAPAKATSSPAARASQATRPKGQRNGKRRNASRANATARSSAKPNASTVQEAVDVEVETDATADGAADAATTDRSATKRSSYSSRVTSASRRGPKSSWSGGSTPNLANTGSGENGKG